MVPVRWRNMELDAWGLGTGRMLTALRSCHDSCAKA